jgi:uncharacterized protein (DUF362 family)/ferredoxin
MKSFRFLEDAIRLAEDCKSSSVIREALGQIISLQDDLPEEKDAAILVKPNLNNDLSALTGNSTDLRILAELIKILQQRGYINITIADGPNVGVFRKGIDEFSRLGVRRLAEHFGVALVNLNHSQYVEIEVHSGSVKVSEICLQADYFINVPKIKTHAEAGMSISVKNLMGCVVGTDTRIMHQDLGANLVSLNEVLKPDLIIVDGLIGMEGNGPGDGEPKRMDIILAGKKPFIMDLLVSTLMGLDRNLIPYLLIAQNMGYLLDQDLAYADQIKPLLKLKPPPPRSLSTQVLEHSYLAILRDLTRFVHGSEWARRLLYRLKIMQDVYEAADADIDALILDQKICDECDACLDICPTELPITEAGFDFFASSDCLGCLYCVFVCPQQAIRIDGKLGYLEAHLVRYGEAMHSLY